MSGLTRSESTDAMLNAPGRPVGVSGAAAAARRGWRGQMRMIRRVAYLVYLPAVLLLLAASAQWVVPTPVLFRDLTTVGGVPFYAGLFSQIGALFWAATVGICLISWAVLPRDGAARWRSFFLVSALITAVLMLDDVFLLHDEILPSLMHNAQKTLYAIYALGTVAYLAFFRATILRTDYLLMLAALGFMAVSVGTDVASTLLVKEESGVLTHYRIVVEDGTKLLGILGWCAYFAITGARQLRGLAPHGER